MYIRLTRGCRVVHLVLVLYSASCWFSGSCWPLPWLLSFLRLRLSPPGRQARDRSIGMLHDTCVCLETSSDLRSYKQPFELTTIVARIAFGDSYTYVQGIYGHQNYSFIGDQLNFEYDAKTLLTNKIVQNQVRRSNELARAWFA